MSYIVLQAIFKCDNCGNETMHNTNQSLPTGWVMASVKLNEMSFRLGEVCCKACKTEWINTEIKDYEERMKSIPTSRDWENLSNQLFEIVDKIEKMD